MSVRRVFYYIAVGHIGLGALLALQAIAAIVTNLYKSTVGGDLGWKDFAVLALFGVLAFAGFALALGGARHKKNPTQKTALVLAINSSVVVWLATSIPFANIRSGSAGWEALAATLAPLLVAYLSYRLVLKPAAMRTFPAVEGGEIAVTR